MPRIIPIAAGFIIVYLFGLVLIAGRSLLIPIVIALLIWHFLNAINLAISKTPKIGKKIPAYLRFICTFLIVGLLMNILFRIISENVTDVINASARYQANIQSIINKLDSTLHIKTNIQLDYLFNDFAIQPILLNIYDVFTSITSSAVLIGLYVVFLFVEQHFFSAKMLALFPQTKHRKILQNILLHMIHDTQTYLGLKTFLSLITAFLSWIIMRFVGLDFAAFWALLIFFLNYIPNIGAIIATLFPSVLAIIQFQAWLPCLIISCGIVSIQFILGNFVEPRVLGQSLNLSPLVILVALAFWGAVWGVLGMFLSVPITVIMMIIFAHFDSTRPISVLLSQNGCIQKTYAKL
ncbi:MAG: AI-2E family transporter [Legionellales bacterium RIFCSPHIGHO2_12_FULL_37_14]|nr:MAG: AI-2E family transporter [Legionellales bacterium RIFCSPHIGHO2_12_FULL_37_14]